MLNRPTLKAILLDFSSVNNVDVTSVQQLIDVRNQLDRYAAPRRVDWHFASINNRWTKRALVAAGFGYPSAEVMGGGWKPIFSIAMVGVADPNVLEEEKDDLEGQRKGSQVEQIEAVDPGDGRKSISSGSGKIRRTNTGQEGLDLKRRDGVLERTAVVNGLNRPLFHIDLTSALQSAVANVRAREEAGVEEMESRVLI